MVLGEIGEKVKKELKKLGVEKELKRSEKHGDFFIEAFDLDGEEIAETFKVEGVKAKAEGNYVNFYVDWEYWGKRLLDKVLKEGKNYGREKMGKKVVIEYSSPNVARPMHVGHLRNTVLGNSLCRIYEFMGNKVIKINWLGDTGTQFGKLILAYKLWGNEEELEKNPIKELLRVYVKFHEEVEKDPKLEEKAREIYAALEGGKEEFVELWKRFRELSIREFKRIYDLLGAKFDEYTGESYYIEKAKKVVEELKKKGLAYEKEGSVILHVEGVPDTVIMKKDGTTLYLTRDLATAIDRYEKYKFDLMLYVVGSEQKLHFRQLFRTLEAMGYEWAKNCKHISYGLIRLPEGKISTRKGRVVTAEEVINRSVEEAGKVMRGIGKFDQEVAEKVGLAAVIYSILKVDPEKFVEFKWDEMLRLKGNTAPYLLYSYVRAKHILDKAELKEFEVKGLKEQERRLLKKLSLFPLVVKDALERNKPNFIANYLYGLCDDFNRFYEECQVLGSEKEEFRVALVSCTKIVLENCFKLLGMPLVEKM